MKLGRFFWKLFVGTALLLVAVLAACVWLTLRELERYHGDQIAAYLESQAVALRAIVSDRFTPDRAEELNQLADTIGWTTDDRLEVIFMARDGTVWGASGSTVRTDDRLLDEPEIRDALSLGRGRSVHSTGAGSPIQAVAVSVGTPGHPVGVVRVSTRGGGIRADAPTLERLTWTIIPISLAAATGLAFALAHLWSRRITYITEMAQSISRGDLSARVRMAGEDEVAQLARALNRMREHLARQLVTIERQKQSLESLLAQLREGVIVAGSDGRILLINPEAVRQLRLTSPGSNGSFVGLPFEQCIPQHDLQLLLRTGWDSSDLDVSSPRDSDESDWTPTDGAESGGGLRLQIPGPEGTVTLFVQAFDVHLPGDEGQGALGGSGTSAGRMLVLTDVTELTKTIQVKADFAANASHELRTPLAALRAALDTLKGVELSKRADGGRYFLDVLERQTARMEAMVADLLDLSRIESPLARFEPTTVPTRRLIAEIQGIFAAEMESKSLVWSVEVTEDAELVRASAELLRIILRNLVENSIRFTPSGGRIGVEVSSRDGQVVFCVRDTGCGIPPEDQQRVFERFYQVERARTGSQRGTGLGLSIVRHAVAAMHGSVELESVLGQGTSVSIRLPRNPR